MTDSDDFFNMLKTGPTSFSAKAKGFSIEDITNIKLKKASPGKGREEAMRVVSEWTSEDAYENFLIVMHTLYSYYSCPSRKDDYLKDKVVDPKFKGSQAERKRDKRERDIDAFFLKYNVTGNVTPYDWAYACSEYITAKGGFVDDTIGLFPKHPNLIYSKGFWACLTTARAKEVYSILIKRLNGTVSQFVTNPLLKAAWESEKKTWRPDELLSIYDTVTISAMDEKDRKALLKKYNMINVHVPNPLFLKFAMGARDAKGNWVDLEFAEFYYTEMMSFIKKYGKKGVTLPAGEWVKKDFETYYENVFKPVNVFATDLRKPIWYVPGGKDSKKVKRFVGLKMSVTGEDELISTEAASILKAK